MSPENLAISIRNMRAAIINAFMMRNGASDNLEEIWNATFTQSDHEVLKYQIARNNVWWRRAWRRIKAYS